MNDSIYVIPCRDPVLPVRAVRDDTGAVTILKLVAPSALVRMMNGRRGARRRTPDPASGARSRATRGRRRCVENSHLTRGEAPMRDEEISSLRDLLTEMPNSSSGSRATTTSFAGSSPSRWRKMRSAAGRNRSACRTASCCHSPTRRRRSSRAAESGSHLSVAMSFTRSTKCSEPLRSSSTASRR